MFFSLKRGSMIATALVSTAMAQPEGVVSSARQEGVMVTSRAQPEFFIFQNGVREEQFDGTYDAMAAQGGYERGEPIAGLHYIRPQLKLGAPKWRPEDASLIDAQFHGAPTGDYYLFKTSEGQLFFLPKEGETRVVRIDYVLRSGERVTVWARK